MNNERNNRLILDNVPFNISIKDFMSPLNGKLEDISKHNEDENLSNISTPENKHQD